MIPTRDRSGLLRLTLRSALGQRDVDLEVVVVDDGSADGTAASVAGFGDPRVRLVRHPVALGVSAARNTGVAHATGEWIALLDDDDLWAPDKLALQLAAARDGGRAWAYAGSVSVDDHLRVLGGGPPQPPEQVMSALRSYNAVPAGASNVVVRADALATAGPFDTRLKRTEDWDMWLRLARGGPPACVSRPLLAYRQHSGSVPADPAAMVLEPRVLERRHGITVDRAAMLRRAAWNCLRAGRRRAGLRYYARAVALGDLRSVGRALVGLAHPAVGTSAVHGLAWRGQRRHPWATEAQAWLDALAAG